MYCFGSTYTKIGTIQRRLAWPLRKDDTQNREAFHIFCPHYQAFSFCKINFAIFLTVFAKFAIFANKFQVRLPVRQVDGSSCVAVLFSFWKLIGAPSIGWLFLAQNVWFNLNDIFLFFQKNDLKTLMRIVRGNLKDKSRETKVVLCVLQKSKLIAKKVSAYHI